VLRVVAADANEFSDHACAVGTSKMEHEIDGVGDLIPDGLIGQLDAALYDAGRKPGECLGRRVRVNRRQRPRMSGIEGLE
jgi:hypothetical protein